MSELNDGSEKLGRGKNSVQIVKELTNFHMLETNNQSKINKRMKYCLLDAEGRAKSINRQALVEDKKQEILEFRKAIIKED